MTVEYFKNLIEAQNLDQLIKKCLDMIESHKLRIKNIEQEKKEKIVNLENNNKDLQQIKNKISTNEKNLYSIENKIQKSKENLLNVKSNNVLNALETEIKSLTPRAEILENESLELMEKVELIKEEISNTSNFLEGIDHSIDIIKEEAKIDITSENSEIKNYNNRIDSLLDNCPKNFKDTFISINKIYKHNNPLAFIKNNSCNRCHYMIDRNLQSNIKTGRTLEFCPGCQRLLIPDVILNIN